MPNFLVELEDGRKLNVESDIAPTDDDINDFLNQGAPPAPSPVSAPSESFLGQSYQKLRTGTQQALAGAKTTLAAVTGFDETTGQGLSDLAAAARQSQDERTPQDIALQTKMQQNAAEFDAAPGFMGKAREFADYAGIALQNPRAAFQMGLQSVPNALISLPAAAAGRAIGAGAGLMAGIESGPGAIGTGLAGMALGSVGANVLMEGGGAIADKISQATGGESANWTPEQFTAFIRANPEVIQAGLKSGAVRGSIIGAVDAASMGLAGRVIKPALGTVGRAGKIARGAAATGIEMASEGAGEALAGYVDTGKVDSQAVFQEVMGGPVTAMPAAFVGRGLSALRPRPTTVAPVADPLAAAAASFPTPPPPSPPTSQVSPPPLPPQPPAPAAPAAPTQTWNVELDDGRQLVVESDTEPTAADIEDFLATPTPSASVNAAPEAARSDPANPERGPASVVPGVEGSTPSTGALSPVSPSPSLPVSESPSPQVPQFSPSSPPLATRKVPVIEDAPYGGQDILDFVNDRPIVIPEIARGGDMNWAERAGLPNAYAKYLTIPGDVGNINEVAQDAYDANFIDDTTPDALMAKIQEVITSRENAKADAKSQQSQMSQAEKAMVLFDKAVARAAKAKTGTQRVPIDAMNKGDTLTLGGETMTVVAQQVNEDGFNESVTLRSESGRLGTVTLTADTPALAVETFTPKSPETAPDSGNAGTWADSVIAASMETPFIGIDPRLMAAYTIKGAQLIREGFTTFTKWSAEMLKRFGAKVRNYLQDVWMAVQKNSQAGGSLPRGERPAKQNPGNLSATGAMISSPKADAVLPAFESLDSFQSAPERPVTGRDYNQYGDRQQQNLAQAKANLAQARNQLRDAIDTMETRRKAWQEIHGVTQEAIQGQYDFKIPLVIDLGNREVEIRTGNYHNSISRPRADRVTYRGQVLWQRPEFDFAEMEESSELREAKDLMVQAEAELFLAEEEDEGRTDRLAAKESAGEWSRRTRAAEFAALLDLRDDDAKNASSTFLAKVWQAFAVHGEAFQFGKTKSKDPDKIAAAVSFPGRQITIQEQGDTLRIMGPNGYLNVNDIDTRNPYIRSTDAESKGKKGGGGTQLYQAALDYIHNTGKTIKDDTGLTDINAIRRTSNFFSSALRWGTTKHLKPHAKQGVKWGKSHVRNIASLAAREMEFTFKAIAEAREWKYDVTRDEFLDSTNQPIDEGRFEKAVSDANPSESGIGISTLQRAIITRSAIEAFQRGETESVISAIEDRGDLPDRLAGILYFDATGLVFVSDVLTTMARQARDLAAFSKQAIDQFGTWIKPHLENLWKLARQSQEATLAYLQDAWQAATTRTMPRMGGGRVTVRRPEGGFVQPGSGPSTANSAPTAPVRLAQADVAAEREAAGKAPLPTGNQFTVPELEAAARAEVQIPGRVQAILDDILAQQRPATPLEHYTLMNYKGQLDAELAQAEGILSDPATPMDDRGDAAARKREADAMKDKLEVVAQISGSRAGAALGVRKFGLDRDDIPTLNKMVADITVIMDPTGRTPLPPEERAKIEEMHKAITDTKAAADKQEEEGLAGAKNTYNLELEKLLKEAQEEIETQKRILEIQKEAINNAAKPRKMATTNKSILKRWADEGDAALERMMAKTSRGQTNFGMDPSDILEYAKIARGLASKGIDFAATIIKKKGAIWYAENVRPFLNQIMDKAAIIERDDLKKTQASDIKDKAREAVKAKQNLPPNLARQFALAHIIDHLERQDNTLSAEKIAKLVADDLQEFFPGIQERQARDLISGYGKTSQPSKEEARVALRDLSAQMQKLTQLEALLAKEPLLKSGPQRQEPSARLRELQKQVEQLKKDTNYQSRSREDELKSIRDRIQKTLKNQIEELQRVLAGQGTPTAPRQRQVYDANLQALQTLRNSLKVLVAELPQHRLASELRRNAAAEAAAKASETEYKRRIKAKEWKAQGKIQGPQTQAVTEARAAAAAARQQFLDLKRASNPAFDPNAKELAAFKKRIQGQIDKLNERIAKGEFDPVKRTPRQIQHDQQSAKLLTDLNKAKRAFIDAKVAARLAKMGWVDKGIEKLRTLLITARSLMTGGEFSGIGRQGLLTALSRPALFAGNLKQMTEAFKSEQNETAIFDKLWKRPNAINGLYKRAKLALHDPDDYSDLLAEGAARSKLANKIPWFSHTGRAYSTLLADMRAELFDMLVAKYEKRTKAPISDRAAEALAEFVNDSTGSGKLGLGKREIKGNAKDFLSLGIFSPAFVASRARLLVAASLWQGDMQSRLLIAEEYIRIIAGMAALIALASALQGDDEEEMELDPRGGGFMKMQFGATSVDLMAGLNSMATFLTRTIKQETKTQKGIQSIRGEDAPYGQNWLDIFVRFARNKLSPGASFAVNRLTGTDPMGRPQTAMQGLGQAVTPITFGAAWDAAMEEPLNRSAALVPAAFLGVSTSTKRPEDATFLKDLQRITGFNP